MQYYDKKGYGFNEKNGYRTLCMDMGRGKKYFVELIKIKWRMSQQKYMVNK